MAFAKSTQARTPAQPTATKLVHIDASSRVVAISFEGESVPNYGDQVVRVPLDHPAEPGQFYDDIKFQSHAVTRS